MPWPAMKKGIKFKLVKNELGNPEDYVAKDANIVREIKELLKDPEFAELYKECKLVSKTVTRKNAIHKFGVLSILMSSGILIGNTLSGVLDIFGNYSYAGSGFVLISGTIGSIITYVLLTSESASEKWK